MSDLVVRARGLGKAYHVYERPVDRLKQALLGGRRRYYREFWALRGVDLDVARGSALAIIGRNGSGKSTLLQLVAGTLTPTHGEIETSGGRIAALLELGSGFNPQFSGRENVYLNAAILGLAREQVDARFDEMLDFAELHDFIDQPVKTYSSGMFVRLAFAVQVFADPEVLIVDEALSVGDVFFQQKCYDRLRRLRDAGVTLLFVSHDTAAVLQFCDQALLLEAGAVAFRGRPEECVTRYHALARAVPGRPGGTPRAAAPPALADPSGTAAAERQPDPAAAPPRRNLIDTLRSRHGTGDLQIVEACGMNALGVETLSLPVQDDLLLLVRLVARRAVARPAFGLHLYDRTGTMVFAAGTTQLGVVLPALAPDEELQLRLRLTCSVYPGSYTLTLAAGTPSLDAPNEGVFHDVVEGLGPLVVVAPPSQQMSFFGVARLPLRIERLDVAEVVA